jgi:hypothetical protein
MNPAEYGEKPARRLTMALLQQHFLERVCGRHSRMVRKHQTRNLEIPGLR